MLIVVLVAKAILGLWCPLQRILDSVAAALILLDSLDLADSVPVHCYLRILILLLLVLLVFAIISGLGSGSAAISVPISQARVLGYASHPNLLDSGAMHFCRIELLPLHR